MDVVVTGSNGFIGAALRPVLERDGHRVVRMVRGNADGGSGDVLRWDLEAGTIDAAGLEGVGAVVHLAGEGIGERKWTPEQKRRIVESRTRGTGLLTGALAGLTEPPKVLVSASAIGWYGTSRGAEPLTEESPPPPDPDFLSRVCTEWEQATAPAQEAGIRVVHLRTGIVLARHGGVLARMLTPFRFGLGGRIGSGRQYMSWISLDDEIGAIRRALSSDGLRGPLNATAPNPVTNAEFTKSLGDVLGRPTVLPTPLFPLKARFGAELVQTLLVEGQRVLPARLDADGYAFAQPTLEAALRSILGRALPSGGERVG